MGDPIDDAFDAAEARANERTREHAERDRQRAVFAADGPRLASEIVDAIRASWQYEEMRHPTVPYEPVDSGKLQFAVTTEGTLTISGAGSPEAAADQILRTYINDCATDMAEAETKKNRH